MRHQLHLEGLTVIVGLGATGLACARFLATQGADLAVNDSRETPPNLSELQQEFPHIPCILGSFDRALLNKAKRLVVSPGVSLQRPEIAEQVARGIEVIGDIELFARLAKAPIVAITGSNGKTTVTTLVGKMIEAAGFKVGVGGNIGRPALELLLEPADYYVLELSSFQLETTYSLRTVAATILNITEDHMDRYASFQDYCAAKQRIYQHCQHPVVNLVQPNIWDSIHFLCQPITFGLQPQADYGFSNTLDTQQTTTPYLLHQGQPLIAINELPLHHPHHLENALAALALGETIGLPRAAILNVLRTFTGLPHRCQLVCQHEGVFWYNDSKGTNVGATIAAILSLGVGKKRSLILIAGGDAKHADLTPLLGPVTTYVDQLILIGQDAPLFYELFHLKVPCFKADSMHSAVAAAKQFTQWGDIVLLSPACASFDMFNNYEHRGEVFAACVRQCSESRLPN